MSVHTIGVWRFNSGSRKVPRKNQWFRGDRKDSQREAWRRKGILGTSEFRVPSSEAGMQLWNSALPEHMINPSLANSF